VLAAAVLQITSSSFVKASEAQPTAPPASGPATPTVTSARIANYDIDVTLDPKARTLTGSELITWRNPGQIAAYSIRLHLY